jgi:hypothetical protein
MPDEGRPRKRAIMTGLVLAAFVLGVYVLTFWRYGHR